MTTKVKRCVYCGGEAPPIECGQDEEELQAEETYVSNFGKQRPKPKNKMIEKHEDK